MSIFKKDKFSKITDSHSEPISDKELVYRIVSTDKAKERLSASSYKSFLSSIDKIAGDNRPFPTDMQRLLDRSFGIAYQFDSYGDHYEDICGASSAFYNEFVLRKQITDSFVNEFVSDYFDVVDAIVEKCNLQRGDTHICAKAFMQMVHTLIKENGRFDCKTDLLPTIFDIVQFNYEMEIFEIVDIYDLTIEESFGEKLLSEGQELLDEIDEKETIVVYLEAFTKRFLKLIGADPNNDELFKLVFAEVVGWGNLAYQESKKLKMK